MYSQKLESVLKTSLQNMAIIPDMIAGKLDREELRLIALNHYAETRAFLDVQLPARMFLCPHNAMRAKKYFNHLYVEEQGKFGKDLNHAELFVPVCTELGIQKEELEAYYKQYERYYFYLFRKEASYESMIEELAISYVWESVTPYFGATALTAFGKHYNFTEKAMKYFDVHFDADDDHSHEAKETLLEYVTSQAHYEIAEKAIIMTLGDDLYLTKRL